MQAADIPKTVGVGLGTQVYLVWTPTPRVLGQEASGTRLLQRMAQAQVHSRFVRCSALARRHLGWAQRCVSCWFQVRLLLEEQCLHGPGFSRVRVRGQLLRLQCMCTGHSHPPFNHMTCNQHGNPQPLSLSS